MTDAAMTDAAAVAAPTLAGLDDLVAAVRPSDTLLAAGSVVAGLGTADAQLDLLLVGPGARPTGAAASVASMRTATYVLASGTAVRVRFCTDQELGEVSSVTERFDEAFVEPAIFANLPHLDLGTQVLLHELRTGVVLANTSIAEAWRATLRLEHLPRYLAAVRLLRFGARRHGVAAQLAGGDAETAQWVLREALEELIGAALATAGETNPRKRWHLRLLRKHAGDLGHDEVERLIGLVQHWERGDATGAVRRGADFADGFAATLLARHPELSLFAGTAAPGPGARA